jgi:hypothetical protein
MIGKSKIETMCRNAGVIPVARKKINGIEVFIADGFSATPAVTFQKFEVTAEEFPFGCYGTFWWIFNDEKLAGGRPLFCDAFHDPQYSPEGKKQIRINAALKDAKDNLKRNKRAWLH